MKISEPKEKQKLYIISLDSSKENVVNFFNFDGNDEHHTVAFTLSIDSTVYALQDITNHLVYLMVHHISYRR